MADYRIVADSACDIDVKTLGEWGVEYVELTYIFEGSEKQYKNYDLDSRQFYDLVRGGAMVKTSAVNSAVFEEKFREILEQGEDILYVAFSSGLSATCQNAFIAAEDLKEEFPDRKIIIVDSLSASAGYGFLLKMVVDKKAEGASIEEAAAYGEEKKLKINHWFTVDDLRYLRKGGRIGSAAAKVANKFGIKPILNVNDAGELQFKYIARGTKSMYKALIEEYNQRAIKGKTVFVCHSDSLDKVEVLQTYFKENFGVTFEYVADIGAVIGGHTGPGTISVFFEGAGR